MPKETKWEIIPINEGILKRLEAYQILYDECMKRIESLMGIPASRMGSEGGSKDTHSVSGSESKGRGLRPLK